MSSIEKLPEIVGAIVQMPVMRSTRGGRMGRSRIGELSSSPNAKARLYGGERQMGYAF